MKAVFKKTAVDKLYEILANAERDRKKIDYLLLTPEEYDEVRHYCTYPWALQHSYEISDMTVRIVELTPRGRDWRSTYRFPVSPYKFHGHDIVVAPAEYH